MEDDITGKIAEEFYFSYDDAFIDVEKSIPLRASAKKEGDSSTAKDANNNKSHKKRGRKRKSESMVNIQSQNIKQMEDKPSSSKDIILNNNISKTFRRKGKLTAAVAPLMKTDTGNTFHGFNREKSPINSIFPATQPPQFYRQTQFESHCYVTPETSMPTCVKCQKQLHGYNQSIYSQNFTNFGGKTCIHQKLLPVCRIQSVNDPNDLQDQPLNLKLGETSIPSGIASKKLVQNESQNQEKILQIQQLFGKKSENVTNAQQSVGSQKGSSSTYDASSPSSTSGLLISYLSNILFIIFPIQQLCANYTKMPFRPHNTH